MISFPRFSTTPSNRISKPIQINIPSRPASVVIMNPIDGSKLPAGSTLYLWGSVMPSTLEKGDPSAVRWIIDGKEVTKGSLEVYVIAPPAGKHSCRLQVEDRGKAIEKSVSFKTISLPKTSKEIEE